MALNFLFHIPNSPFQFFSQTHSTLDPSLPFTFLTIPLPISSTLNLFLLSVSFLT